MSYVKVKLTEKQIQKLFDAENKAYDLGVSSQIEYELDSIRKVIHLASLDIVLNGDGICISDDDAWPLQWGLDENREFPVNYIDENPFSDTYKQKINVKEY